MDRTKIDEEFVKEVLGNHGGLLQDIHKRVLLLYEELSDTGSLIQAAAIKKMALGKIGGGSRNVRDLTDVMLVHQRLVKDREREVYAGLMSLMDEEEAVNRVWCCFNSLPDKERGYLERLYVIGEPYKAVERSSGVSHRAFEQARARAMGEIMRTYDSDLANVEIIARGRTSPGNRGRNGKGKKSNKGDDDGTYRQLELNL